jgi:hypothetical protein
MTRQYKTKHDTWLRVEEIVLKIPNYMYSQLTHSSDTHTYPTDMSPGVILQSPNPEQIQERAIIAWNYVPSNIAQMNSKPGLKNRQKAASNGTTPLPFNLYSLCASIDIDM